MQRYEDADVKYKWYVYIRRRYAIIVVVVVVVVWGTDINSLDRLGRTPLHLAVGHLRLLHEDREYSSQQLKAAVAQVNWPSS